METAPTPNSNSNNLIDKPDELVSQRNAQMHMSNQNVIQVPQVELQANQQQKKCLHHRIFDTRIGNSMSEQVAAFTSALIQQANQPAQSQLQQSFTTLQSQQQQQSNSQPHRISHSQTHVYQQPIQQTPTNNTTHFTVGVNNPTNNGQTSSLANTTTIHNQNGLVQQMSATLLADRYLLLDLVEGSTLYKCIDVKSREELVCKVKQIKLYVLFMYVSLN